jgi:MFS family permease
MAAVDAAPAPLSSAQELSRGWPILLSALVGFGLGLSALTFYTNQVFVDPLMKEFGWKASQIQAGIVAMPIGTVLMAPIIGKLCDSIGARPVVLVSIALYAISVASFSLLTPSLTGYYLHWVAMSVLGAGTLAITWTKAINGWFDRSRGIALGIALAGSGITGFIAPQIANWAIGEHGWRTAYLIIAALPAVIALPTAFLLFRDPPKVALAPGAAPVELPGLTGGQALKTPRFWIMWIAFFMISIGVGALIPNMFRILVSDGFQPAQAAQVAGLIGLSVIAGRIVAGILLDRIWAPLVAFVFLTVPAISCLLLANPQVGLQYLAVAAVLVGLAAGAEFDLIAYMVSRYFGMKAYGQIYSWQFIGFGIGSGFVAPVPELVKEQLGSYDPALYVIAALFVIGGTMLLLMGRYPKEYARADGH